MKSLLAACMILGLLTSASVLAADNPAEAGKPAATATTAPPAAASPVAPLPFKTDKENFSYAIGMMLGTQLKAGSIDVDADLVSQGLKDALGGGKAQMTDDQVRAAITALQHKMSEERQQKMKELGEKNKTEGAAFLEQNAKKEGIVVLPSGLQYKVLTDGTGVTPKQADTVMVNYRGTLIDGTEFDSSTKAGGPVALTVNGVIAGMSEALKLMKVGSKWQLFIPSNLGYGERAMGPIIGPNSALIFEVELVSIK